MEFKELLAAVLLALKHEIEANESLKTLKHCLSEDDLRSSLRDRLFRTDDKTNDFILSIVVKHGKSGEIVIPKRTELTQSEFTDLIFTALNKTLKEKSSKFKYVSHYFSPEHDLSIKVSDVNGFETNYRVLVVKTT